MAGPKTVFRRATGPVLLFTAVAAVVGGVWLRPSVAEGPAAYTTDSTPPPSPHDMPWQGPVSCSSTACHGKDAPLGSKGTEYRTFLAVDPHRNAYKNFDLAALIERNFNKRRSTSEAKPLEESVCLNCHGMNVGQPARDATAKSLAGAGCEACHGPAGNWLTTHYLAGWQQQSDAQKERQGMHPTKNLIYRGRACVECHVGTAGREVNHDLMACGHPRLNFEYSAYLAMYPKHWSERAEVARYPDLEARAWAIGQVVSAQASLKLLEARAKAAEAKKNTAPWPEFAEYDCSACHHNFQAESWREKRGYGKHLPGSLPWSTWYQPMVRGGLADLFPGASVDGVATPLKDLAGLMNKPYGAQGKVADEAAAASKALEGWLRDLPARSFPSATLNQLFESIEKQAKTQPATSWDEEAKRWLALTALHRTLAGPEPGSVATQRSQFLQEFLGDLRKSARYNTPTQFTPK